MRAQQRWMGSHIDMAGDAGNGVLATGTAEVVLQDASIGRVGHSGVAATAHRGARLVMKGVDIDMRGDAAVGLAMGGSVNVSDSRISVQGAHGRAVDRQVVRWTCRAASCPAIRD